MKKTEKTRTWQYGLLLLLAAMVLFASSYQTQSLPATGQMKKSEVREAQGVAAIEAAAMEEPQRDLGKALTLINGENPLPENYQMIPAFFGDETVEVLISKELTDMVDAAYQADIVLWVASGYRSEQEQETLLKEEIQRHQREGLNGGAAREKALETMALPGFSEHHSGLAVDFNTVDAAFKGTAAYRWLQEHGAEYGFVQRYQKEKEDITGIAEECWHFRYVGTEHANRMKELNMCLEEYVAYLLKMPESA